MKNLIFALIAATLFFSCDEISPEINPIMDTISTDICDKEVDVSEQKRNVLIEEYTGVRCVNCPQGSETIEAIIEEHGDCAVAISLHTGDFAIPYGDSNFDFRTSEGDAVFDMLGAPLGYPAAIIGRREVSPNNRIVLGDNQWPGMVADQLQLPLTLKLGVAHEYDAETGVLDICAKIYPQEEITFADVRVSIFITENNIVDKQKTPDGDQSDYVHKHVFRGSVTPAVGTLVTESLGAGEEILKSFTYNVPSDWVAENCEIVALVHNGGNNLDVYQVVQVGLVE